LCGLSSTQHFTLTDMADMTIYEDVRLVEMHDYRSP
jgi:hypothetical protein